eukprot:gene17851-19634_t
MSRSSTGYIHDKNLCIWCMKPEDKKNPGRDRWHLLQQMNSWNTFKRHTMYLEDATMRECILAVIRCTPDPFAAEIRYHKSCWKKYISPTYSWESNDQRFHLQDVHLSEVKEMFFSHVRKVVIEMNEPRTLKGLLLDYENMLRNFGFDTNTTKTSTIKNMLQKEFDDKIGFHNRYHKNMSTIVYDTSSGGSFIEAAMYSWGVDDEQLLNTVARRLKNNFAGDARMSWPPRVDELEQKEEPNLLLRKFLTWLKDPAAKDFDENCKSPEIASLASLLYSFISGNRSSFQTKLSMTIHGLTRSREIIDLLKKFSLGISYQDVLDLYAAWAKFELETDEGCPEEIASNVPGTVILDNDDFQDDTLTGAGTSHRTNVMFVQPENTANVICNENRPKLSLTKSLDVEKIIAEQNRILPYKTFKRGVPEVRKHIDVTPTDTKKQRARGIIHSLTRLDENGENVLPENQSTGSFSGFQSNIQLFPVKSKPFFYLTLPKPPGKSVVNEVMNRVVAVAKKKSMPFVQLVGDQPVYTLIVQLKYENAEQFDLIVPFLGPFHTQCSFMSAINKRFKGSGLSDVLVAAGAVAEGSVDRALGGKHYKQGIRCLRLMYEALIRQIVQESIGSGQHLRPETKEMLRILQKPSSTTRENLISAHDTLEASQEFSNFISKAFEELEHSESHMAKYWLSFLEMVEILMQNIHALRTQNWEEFKISLRSMLPWMQIYDNNKYGRWLVEFWLQMSCLPEEKAQYLYQGLFAQSMTGKPYSCLPLDLWIEMTMNKGSKMKAGWKRILQNEKMLMIHTRNANSVNRVRVALHAMANLRKATKGHRENSTFRLKTDEQVVQDIDKCLTEFNSKPFDLSNDTLRTLQSGMIASDKLVHDFETAHRDGEVLATKFFNERMFSNEKSFDDTMHRNARHTFDKPPSTEKEKSATIPKTVAMENKAMAQIMALAQSSAAKIDLVQIMGHRVTEECLSIFNINATMIKVQKSKLVEKLKFVSLSPMDSYTAIVDMGFIWRLATPTTEDREKNDGTYYTWNDYADRVFSLVLSRHRNASEIIFVNDPYDLEMSIKDSEHDRRAGAYSHVGGTRNVFIRMEDRLPPSKEFQNFFKNPGNKIRLQQFLRRKFSSLAALHPNINLIYSVRNKCWKLLNTEENLEIKEFECHHIEADTILFFLYSQIRKQDAVVPVVIDAEDTDVLVLAAHVAHKVNGILGLKRKKEIYDCKQLCTEEVSKIIVPLHIHTGADAVSGFFGHGKKSVVEKTVKSSDAMQLLKDVGKSVPATPEVMEHLANFTIRYVYGDRKSTTLAEARALKWEKMKNKSTRGIPPDQDSHDLKAKRVNYQTNILINFDKPDHPPSPLNHGWTLENGKCQPLRYTKAPLPEKFELPASVGDDEDDDDDDGNASDTSSFCGSDSDLDDEVSEEECESDLE